jgi:arylsulfatase A-like enzyme
VRALGFSLFGLGRGPAALLCRRLHAGPPSKSPVLNEQENAQVPRRRPSLRARAASGRPKARRPVDPASPTARLAPEATAARTGALHLSRLPLLATRCWIDYRSANGVMDAEERAETVRRMRTVKNILFVMYDQLRADYISCYGHPTIKTPAMDALAARGVIFTKAYCQSPVCGPSRMSFYTGRYVSSHGTTWNNIPMEVSERTIGDYLGDLQMRVALVGISHFVPDLEGMKRLGLSPTSELGRLIAQGGFEPWEDDYQIHPDSSADLDFAYNQYLRKQGYAGANPWHEYANSAQGPHGEVLSGWLMRNAHLPARVREEHSEIAYLTERARQFIADAGDDPWCLHLSYMKPHWPYMAPAPYHHLYGETDVLPANRTNDELAGAHPVARAFMQHDDSVSFREDTHRRHVIPTYMGLISQADAHLGALLEFMERRGLLENTLIVLTSDHGSYLGDHWLGEKLLFHEESVRIPMIIFDPSSEADVARGRRCDDLVQAIDLLPTFIEAVGGVPNTSRLEGRSLLPQLRGRAAERRTAVFSEQDYSHLRARRLLNVGLTEARCYMVRTDRWKYVLYEKFRPQMFDLEQDPHELCDLGDVLGLEDIRLMLREALFAWFRQRKMRRNTTDAEIEKRTDTSKDRGVFIEIW